MRQDPVYLLCYVTAKVFRVLLIRLPDLQVQLVPNSGSILSMCALYLFAQALALLWGFLAVALAVASSIAIQSLDDECPIGATCAARAEHAQHAARYSWYFWRLIQFLARTYQHYACLAVWWFLASSLFELGWEM